ncbi:MAG: hydrogenase maturation nickel metallochaperone HypA [Candidatus Hodarchaeota archaeon]
MHELSLADSIINTALDVAKEHGANSIKQVTIEIGSFALVQLDQLKFCIDIIAEKTIAAQAHFKILQKAGEISCLECGFNGKVKEAEEYTFGMSLFACPRCSSLSTQILSGREVIVRSVDLSIDSKN